MDEAEALQVQWSQLKRSQNRETSFMTSRLYEPLESALVFISNIIQLELYFIRKKYDLGSPQCLKTTTLGGLILSQIFPTILKPNETFNFSQGSLAVRIMHIFLSYYVFTVRPQQRVLCLIV